MLKYLIGLAIVALLGFIGSMMMAPAKVEHAPIVKPVEKEAPAPEPEAPKKAKEAPLKLNKNAPMVEVSVPAPSSVSEESPDDELSGEADMEGSEGDGVEETEERILEIEEASGLTDTSDDDDTPMETEPMDESEL